MVSRSKSLMSMLRKTRTSNSLRTWSMLLLTLMATSNTSPSSNRAMMTMPMDARDISLFLTTFEMPSRESRRIVLIFMFVMAFLLIVDDGAALEGNDPLFHGIHDVFFVSRHQYGGTPLIDFIQQVHD